MIIINGEVVKLDKFGDGSLKCAIPNCCKFEKEKASTSILPNPFGWPNPISGGEYKITWAYDSDEELFALWSLVGQIRDNYITQNPVITLSLPYIPHARQDRNVSGRLFTLKYFAQLINLMNFNSVTVLDPHSDVATALIDRVRVEDVFINSFTLSEGTVKMYPDAGAAKKYHAGENDIIGNKRRDENGRISSYDLINFKEGTKKVVIIDDICSYGGTFVAAASELLNRGVEDIVLVVSHCENHILDGDVFKYVDSVITTDSICTVKHEKLTVLKRYRKYEENI